MTNGDANEASLALLPQPLQGEADVHDLFHDLPLPRPEPGFNGYKTLAEVPVARFRSKYQANELLAVYLYDRDTFRKLFITANRACDDGDRLWIDLLERIWPSSYMEAENHARPGKVRLLVNQADKEMLDGVMEGEQEQAFAVLGSTAQSHLLAAPMTTQKLAMKPCFQPKFDLEAVQVFPEEKSTKQKIVERAVLDNRELNEARSLLSDEVMEELAYATLRLLSNNSSWEDFATAHD
ncbi:hypothetical protein P153DRAFT_429151 [Dothidotthia symphoricarpi CBS 119687]|uniref:Uncharacterized protein n=1 Tax=Dothidotthia symphoricarpi CBS 119687 TaxID=1392245 RepID=A0A6A6AN50_9PLEO|nr:uncharacterized protein P153DRAFT_429151 [Dothidotthia symphoricarpi CBS 119687]KAF2131911.1 hypothetical protein P153DRAFT_429151 [Dothidotthia symphoricarpi CBS 119687]